MTNSAASSTAVTVVCNVRTTLFLDPIDSKIETLRSCESDGLIDGLVMRTWPDTVNLTEDSPYQETIDLFDRYATWANRHGVSIEPPFDKRTTTSLATDSEWEVLRTPVLCLAIYGGSGLLGVFPHTDGDVTYSAADVIGSLRTGELPPMIDEPPVVTPDIEPQTEQERPDGCPDCSAALVNVQGLLTCTKCPWSTGKESLHEPVRP